METKVISYVLVASLLFSVGCYSTGIVTKEELKAKPEQDDITVYTKDSLEYRFHQGNYHIQADTMSGFQVSWMGPDTFVRDSTATLIGLSDITSIERREYNHLKTILFTLGIGAIVVLIAAASSGSNI